METHVGQAAGGEMAFELLCEGHCAHGAAARCGEDEIPAVLRPDRARTRPFRLLACPVSAELRVAWHRYMRTRWRRTTTSTVRSRRRCVTAGSRSKADLKASRRGANGIGYLPGRAHGATRSAGLSPHRGRINRCRKPVGRLPAPDRAMAETRPLMYDRLSDNLLTLLQLHCSIRTEQCVHRDQPSGQSSSWGLSRAL